MSGAGSDFTTALPIVKHDDPIQTGSCSLEKKLIDAYSRNRVASERSTERWPRRLLPSGRCEKPESFTRKSILMPQHRSSSGEHSDPLERWSIAIGSLIEAAANART